MSKPLLFAAAFLSSLGAALTASTGPFTAQQWVTVVILSASAGLAGITKPQQ